MVWFGVSIEVGEGWGRFPPVFIGRLYRYFLVATALLIGDEFQNSKPALREALKKKKFHEFF